MHRITQHFRYTLRQWAKSPVLILVCVLTIALGVGANTAIYSVMNAVLLRYLPVPNPEQLVYLHLRNQPAGTSQTGYNDTSLSMPVYEQMRNQKHVFSDVIALIPLAFGKVAVRFDRGPEHATGEMVSGNFFSGLGVRLAFGRGFTDDDETKHSPTAVLNYSWWTQRFGQDPGVIGQTLYVKGLPFVIVGVTSPGFEGADPGRPMDFWIPAQNRPELNAWGNSPIAATLYGSPNWLCVLLVGRLHPGITWKQAISELTPGFQRAISTGVTEVDPKQPKPLLYFTSARGIENLRANYEKPLRFLMGMVIVVLTIACSNIVMLLIARNAGRRREFGLRIALGASSGDVLSQLLTESILMVSFGAILGWWLAVSGSQALVMWSGVEINVSPDHNVLLFTAALAALVAVLFGIAPARTVMRLSLNEALKTTASTSNIDRNQQLGQKIVIAMQICFSFVLLVVCGLLFRTLQNLESQKLGMRTEGLLVFGMTPEKNIHSDADAVRFHLRVLDRVRNLPGVTSATTMEIRFGNGGSNNNGAIVDGRTPLSGQRVAPVRVNSVGPGFLDVLGIPILRGRDITESDTARSEKVAVVNETFVRRYIRDDSPLGHHISLLSDRSTQYTVVGVAKNSRYTGIRESDRPMVYFPFTQSAGISSMQYVVRTSGNPKLLIPTITKLVSEIDPDLPIEKPTTQRAQFDESISQERLTANLATFFGLLAALLVAVGLYGTLMHNVNRRTVEIGVRMALGAEHSAILRLIFRDSFNVAAKGLGLGIPVSFFAARTLRSLLYGLTPTDPATMGLALLSIGGVIFLASYLPARNAASVDPLVSLRAD